MDFLTDKDDRVVIAVQESLQTLIQYKPNLIDKSVDDLVPVLMTNMVSSD